IDYEDVWILAQNWLNPVGTPGDVVGRDGVNMADFAVVVSDWGKGNSAVVITEINYDHDVKTDPLEYVELHNRTAQDVNISNWHFCSGVTYQFPPDTSIPGGGYIAVAQNPDRVKVKYNARAAIVYGPWIGRLDNDGERVRLCDAKGNEVDEVDYQLGFPWPTVGDSVPDADPANGTGHSIQVLNPYIDNDLGGSWRSRYPTPSARNTISPVENLPPHMRQVRHRPKEPEAGEDVRITVKVTDDDGVAAVTLEYQLVQPGYYANLNDRPYGVAWTPLAMTDDGMGADEEAGDDTYTAVIDGSLNTHRLLARYRITATDTTGLSIRGPYEDDPVPNFAYFVYDGAPAWEGAIQPGVTEVVSYSAGLMNSLPVYHLISKKTDVETCTWISKYAGHEYRWWGTLVYDGKVYDHIRFRARGGVWRYAMGKNMWKFDFNRGHYFQARDDYGRKYDTKWDKINFSACIQQGNYWHRGEQGMFEAAGFKLFNLAGVPSPKTHYVTFRIIDEAEETGPTQYDGDFWGLYLVIEQMDGRFLDEHGLPDGNLYKMEGGTGELNNQGPTATTNKSDLNAFMNGYKTSPNADWWRANVDIHSYFGYRTIVDGIHHYDIGSNKNYFYYLNPMPNLAGDYLWSELPWDLDLTWADNMYDCGNSGLSPFKRYGLWEKAELRVERNNRIREIRDLLLNDDQGFQLIEDLASIIDTPQTGPSMVDADRAMWDYNPIMTSGYVNQQKAGVGRFYAGSPPAIVIPEPGGFRGMVQLMKDYIVKRAAVGDPTEGEAALDDMAYDPAIPRTPTITYTGSPGYPINTLTFVSTPIDDPDGINWRPATKWQIAEISTIDQSPEGTIVPGQAQWKYFKGVKEPSEIVGAWRELDFIEDANWIEQQTPIGYGETFIYPQLFDMRGNYSTVYLRKEFNVSNIDAFDRFAIEALYDDGFSLWINGTFAGRRNISGRNPNLPYNAVTATHSEVRNFTPVEVLNTNDYLQNGRNIVAVHLVNQSLSESEDCFIDVRLIAEVNEISSYLKPRPHYEIEPVWESSDDNAYQPAIRIPASVVRIGHRYRVRCKMRDDTGRYSHWSEPVEFVVAEQEQVNLLTDLRITEVMYNPAEADTTRGELPLDGDQFEFVELKNTGTDVNDVIDLTYVSFIGGIRFDFAGSNVTNLGPGEFALVVRNKAAFESRYSTQYSAFIAGEYGSPNPDFDTKLSNSGETITLADMWHGIIANFTYSDSRGWPLPADGTGHSLVPIRSTIPYQHQGSLDYGGNWKHSAFMTGSPGQDDPDLPTSVVINELMAHTDYSNPAYPDHDSDDWIELYNTTGRSINLSGYYLTDDKDEPNKWAIPAVSIPAGGHISFNEVTHFHNPITTGFGLNKAGEVLILSYLPGTYEDRVIDHVRFKGEENFISLGRYPDGGEYWFHQSPSRDLSNNPGILDIVIDEIMYHPMDPAEEYVELYNPTAFRIYLQNAAGAWRLDDENTQGYVFDLGTYINPGERLVVVGFDPATETERLGDFIAAYATGPLAPGTQIVGPMPGNLANGGERISLKRPQAPDLPETEVSWVVVDEVVYSDVPPWWVEADGTGLGLQRKFADEEHSGNDPANWLVASPSPGLDP
ncbi:MAG: lamin tail domain-containing protein, partial [Planctomycetota bacterium]